MNDQKLVVVAQLAVNDEFAVPFAKAIDELATASRVETGCQAYDVYCANDAVSKFLIYEVWATKADWLAHRHTSHMEQFKLAARSMQASTTVEKFTLQDAMREQ